MRDPNVSMAVKQNLMSTRHEVSVQDGQVELAVCAAHKLLSALALCVLTHVDDPIRSSYLNAGQGRDFALSSDKLPQLEQRLVVSGVSDTFLCAATDLLLSNEPFADHFRRSKTTAPADKLLRRQRLVIYHADLGACSH